MLLLLLLMLRLEIEVLHHRAYACVTLCHVTCLLHDTEADEADRAWV
jgi:hypothetical protein